MSSNMIRRRFGVMPLGFPRGLTDRQVIQYTLDMIARALRSERMIAFVGSGLSSEHGLPSWLDVTNALVEWYNKESETEDPISRAEDTAECYFTLEELDYRLAEHDKRSSAIDRHLKPKLHGELRIILKESEIGDILADSRKKGGDSSLHALITKLGIRRFITLNWDTLIEHVLQEEKSKTLPHINWDGQSLGNRADDMTPWRLIELALGGPGSRDGVFHCHGSTTDPESILLTDAQSQSRYLGDDPPQRLYRRGLRTALLGNPVLFVGTGLGEPEIIRPLSRVLVNRNLSKSEIPLFALMVEREDGEFADRNLRRRRRFELRMRYGIKALFVPYDFHELEGGDRSSSKRSEPSSELRDALGCIIDWRTRCGDGWRALPAVRPPKFTVNESDRGHPKMIRHKVGGRRLCKEREADLRNMIEECRSTLFVGPGGTGKGTLAAQLAEEWSFGRVFGATLHFSNEYLSTVQAAMRFLAPSSSSRGQEAGLPNPGGIFGAFVRTMEKCEPGSLLIIGGLERLLTPPPSEIPVRVAGRERRLDFGVPINREAERFLEALSEIANGPGHCVVAVSSAQLPLKRLVSDEGEPYFEPLMNMELVPLGPPVSDEAEDKGGARFSKLMNRHSYVMDLLRTQTGGDWEQPWCRSLLERMHSTPTARLELVLQAVLRQFLSSAAPEDLDGYGEILTISALLTTPVPTEVFRLCMDAKENETERMLEALVESRLLLHVAGRKKKRYTAHTVLRNFILHSLGERPSFPGEHHIFEYCAFHQDSRSWRLASPLASKKAAQYFDMLIPDDGSDSKVSRHAIRSAFGLLRSNWSATSIASLPSVADTEEDEAGTARRSGLEQYLVRLSRLLNAFLRDEANHQKRGSSIEGKKAHLYVDEVGWIYNEMGWAFFCQGSLPDAWIHFRAFYKLSEALEESDRRGHRTCRAHLNLAHWFIERASLDRARTHVDQALGRARELKDVDAEAQGMLLLGLVYHLSGMLSAGEAAYTQAIDLFSCTPNQRGLSAAYRHRGDLRRVHGGSRAEAENDLHESRMIAETGGHGDLYWFARVAHCFFRATEKNDLKGQDTLVHALDFARKVGLRSLEADVQKVQAAIALRRGDLVLAEQLVFENLSNCSAMGMRIRKTSAIVLLGQVAARQRNLSLARQALETAIRHSQHQGYNLQTEAARRELITLQPSM